MAWHDEIGRAAGGHLVGWLVVSVCGAVVCLVRLVFTNQRKVALLEHRLNEAEKREVRREEKLDLIISRIL